MYIYSGITFLVVKRNQLFCGIEQSVGVSNTATEWREGGEGSSSKGRYRGILDQQNVIIQVGTVPKHQGEL